MTQPRTCKARIGFLFKLSLYLTATKRLCVLFKLATFDLFIPFEESVSYSNLLFFLTQISKLICSFKSFWLACNIFRDFFKFWSSTLLEKFLWRHLKDVL